MKAISLSASARTREQSPKTLRAQGQVPCVVYGNAENTLIAVEEMPLKKAYMSAGESTLVELEVEGKKVPVLFHALDLDPLTDRFVHVDFYAVDMKKEVEADVHIHLVDEAPAVKELGGILVHTLHAVTVKALPANLPHDLPVSLTTLVEFGSTLTVKDIPVPAGVTILNELDEVIALVQEPRAEEVAEAPVAADAAAGEAATGAGEAPAEGEKKEGE